MAQKKIHDPDGDLELDIANNQQTTAESHEKPGLGHPAYEELEAQLNAAEAKASENWDKLLRLQADVENQVRRHERDLAQAHKFANESVFRSLLDVADNLERSLEQPVTGESVDALRTGVELTLKLLLKLFDKHSLNVVNPMGENFNPDLHEAMSMQEDATAKPGTVITVLQKGYQLHDRLLRPALVVVAKAPQNA